MYTSLEKQIGRSSVIHEINTHNLCFLHCVLNVSLFFIHNMHDPEYIQKLEDSFISFHGEGISKAPNAIDLLSHKVSVEYNNIFLYVFVICI